jgi:PPOX class probable F420-dependent enzyme
VTLAADGRPRPVPIAYAFDDAPEGLVIYSALDEKRKAVADPRALARVRDIGTRPRVAVLVDHWEEDWAHLAWVRLEGTATVLEPPQGGAVASAAMRTPPADHAHAVSLLRSRYPQYATHALETRPIVRIAVERVSGWSA